MTKLNLQELADKPYFGEAGGVIRAKVDPYWGISEPKEKQYEVELSIRGYVTKTVTASSKREAEDLVMEDITSDDFGHSADIECESITDITKTN